MRVIMLGAPGAGKGTMSALMEKKYGIVQISTGDILRAEVKAETDLGLKASEFMNRGDLVPDDIILGMMKNRLQKNDCSGGFILDGFPRTLKQAEDLGMMLERLGMGLDAVINLEVPEDLLIRRLTSRRTCSNPSCQAVYNIYTMPPKKEGVCDICGAEIIQREDETEEVIRKRLATYNEKTAPLIRYYSGYDVFFSVPCLEAGETMDKIVERF
ncbi:MAG: adenylate kinase [Spirochaetes bacterium]|jgi:adenylate kinase|nr:adenylate kinase [Spirochaetota bacterium]